MTIDVNSLVATNFDKIRQFQFISFEVKQVSIISTCTEYSFESYPSFNGMKDEYDLRGAVVF